MVEEGTKRFYDLHAGEYFRATYSRDLSPLWGSFCERLARPARLLDLGCGSGRDTKYFLSRGYAAVGLDASLPLLHLAKAHVGDSFVQGDMTSLPFRPQCFDGVWAVGSLLHVPRAEILSVLRRLHTVLSGRGILLTSLKAGVGEARDALGRYNVFYSEPEWRGLLWAAGLQTVEASERPATASRLCGRGSQDVWLTHIAVKLEAQKGPNRR